MSALEKPVPVPSEEDRPYWDGAREHRLVLYRCTSCGRLKARHVIVCSRCRGEDFEWSAVSGRGRIFSFTVARQTSTRGFADEVPYVVVLVAIDEDPSLVITTNLVGDFDVDALDLDLPVEAVFEERGDAVVPQFALVGSA
ncbi:MAG: OB-fold domain-containing protein [Acidimicrobiia bacterium]